MNQDIIDERNEYGVDGDVATLRITRRNGKAYDFMFDADRLDDVKKNVWRVMTGRSGGMYAVSGSYYADDFQFLHHKIVGRPNAPLETYFADGDAFNVRAANLKVGSKADALAASRAFRQQQKKDGHVTYHKRDDRWQAYGYRNGRKVYVGSYRTKEEAEGARRQWTQAYAA